MKKIYSVFTILAVLLSAGSINAQGLSGEFTIGASSADYETFIDAIDDLQTQGVDEGGVIFTIQPGIYDERFVLEDISGLDENSRLTFMAEPGTVIFEATGTAANNDAFIRVNALSYITFDGIDLVDVSNPGDEIEYGFYFLGATTAGCSNNIIRNSSVFLGASGDRPITATRGIFFSSLAQSVEASNSNNIIDNVSIDNAAWGIQFRCAANFLGQITQPDFNNQIINSTFGANQSLGHDLSSGALAINALGGRDMVISNNTIEKIENFNSAPALPVSTSGISLDSCSGIVSENFINHIEYEGTIGSVFGIRTSTFAGDTTLIVNNKISGLIRSNFTASTTDPSLTITGIWIFSQSGNNGLARVLHNSIYLESENPVSYSSAGVNLSGGSSGQFPGEVFNNIIINRISTDSEDYRSFGLVDGNTSRGFLISDNNNLFADGENGYLGAIGRELGGSEQFSNDLEEFILFSETNENSVSFLPEFEDPAIGDLSFSSGLISAEDYFGPTLPEVPLDIIGETRGLTETFLGAYEGPELLSISDINQVAIALYPNPASSNVTIQSNYFIGNEIELGVYNQLGQMVIPNQKMNVETNEINFSVESLSSGIYFVKVHSNGSSTTKKLIVR
jgi:hypothetical protein